MALSMYAQDHGGRFPFSTNGYGDALLSLSNEISGWWASVTGPGYDAKPFTRALAAGTHLAEEDCGRVYVQGLCKTNDPKLALLFDKLATPGGDHCHLFRRMWAPLAREVWTVGGEVKLVRESDWPAFAEKQITLLVAAGRAQNEARKLYSPKLAKPSS